MIIFSQRISNNKLFFKLYPWFSDELGHVLAWKKVTIEDVEEYENVGKVHLESASINTVSAELVNDYIFKIFVQVKAGYIKTLLFNNNGFKAESETISCGTYTFCRMATLRCEIGTLISYPSTDLENAVNVLIEGKNYLVKNFLIQASGMCLFTKLYNVEGQIHLVCGYESGKLVVTKIYPPLQRYDILFEERLFEESCTDADLFDGTIVAVSAGKSVKIIRNYVKPDSSIMVYDLPFPGCNTVVIRSDGKLFVTGGWDGKLRYFSMKTGKLLAIIDHHFDAISSIKFRNDSDALLLLAASTDGTISLWTLYT